MIYFLINFSHPIDHGGVISLPFLFLSGAPSCSNSCLPSPHSLIFNATISDKLALKSPFFSLTFTSFPCSTRLASLPAPPERDYLKLLPQCCGHPLTLTHILAIIHLSITLPLHQNHLLTRTQETLPCVINLRDAPVHSPRHTLKGALHTQLGSNV